MASAMTLEATSAKTAKGKTYGYVRVSTDKQAMSPEVQKNKIVEAAKANGRNVDGWFTDAPSKNPDGTFNDAQSGKVPIAERKAGRELCARLKQGDLVVVATVDRGFRKLSDMVVMLDRWERLGVNLILCDFPMLTDLSNPFQKAFIQIIGVFAEVERKLIAQRTREALALRKRKGHAVSKYAGYGFSWEKRWDREQSKYVKVKVSNEDERSAMKLIVKWKLDGHGWDAITEHLTDQGVLTKEGKPWSVMRVRRAFRAELALQSRETRKNER